METDLKILFLNPPFLPKFSRSQRSPAVIKSGTIYYPLWLAYAAGFLLKQGFGVNLIDAPAEGYDLSQTLDLVNPNNAVQRGKPAELSQSRHFL